MTNDGSKFKRLHLDETHGEDRPYDAYLLGVARNNAVFLNRERGHDCSIAWPGSKAGSNVRAEKIRPWRHLRSEGNKKRPPFMSIWRTWILAGQGVKTIELDLWYRVSDPVSDPGVVAGTGEGESGTNQSSTAVDVRLNLPGALQPKKTLPVTTLTPARDGNGEELWQRARLEATVAGQYAASIDHYAEFLLSLEIQSTPIDSVIDSAEVVGSSFPSRLDTGSASFFRAVPNSYDPLGSASPWTMYVRPNGHPSANIVSPGDEGSDSSFSEVDTQDFTNAADGESVDLRPLSYLQIRAGAVRTTYYDLETQFSGANIAEEETRALLDPSGGVPRKIAQNLNDARRRPEPLCLGPQSSSFTDAVDIDENASWGADAPNKFSLMHGYHIANRQSAYPGFTDSYSTVYDERGAAPRHASYAKFVTMGMAFISTLLDSRDAGWEDLDAGIIADIDWRATVYQIEGSGPTQVGQDTATSTDAPVYLTNSGSNVQILQQLHELFRPSGGTATNEPNLVFTEGMMDLSPELAGDLPGGSPHTDYMTPDLWCDMSGRNPDLPLRFTLECKFDVMTPEDLSTKFESIFRSNLNGVAAFAFSVWGFDL